MLHLRPQIVAAASIRAAEEDAVARKRSRRKRPLRGRRFALAVWVGLCVATSPAAANLETPAAALLPLEPSILTHAQNPRFGFAAGGNLHNFAATDLARYLDGARAANAGWIRIDLNWHVIQYDGPTRYNWAPFDDVVKAITARGMRVLAGILYTPPWARASGTSPNYPPANPIDYASFLKAAVARYAPMGVHAYEIWNEPNIARFWAPGPDPARYTRLLKLAHAAIKTVDPSATVLSAGLSPFGSYGQRDAQHMNPLNFLEAMYAYGAAGAFDALGWHPSNYPSGLAFAGWSAWSQMSQTTRSARRIMRARGDGAKQIWATEFGYPTGSTSRDVSEAKQAQLVTDSYAALRRWSWAGPAFYYSYQDSGTDKLDLEQNFGIVRYDYSPKPSYRAYQRAAAAG
jgi:polysaccharide biosynthesis protein PslG